MTKAKQFISMRFDTEPLLISMTVTQIQLSCIWAVWKLANLLTQDALGGQEQCPEHNSSPLSSTLILGWDSATIP